MAKFIDNGIEKFASYLRDRNNLDHITYLKVRLGMQTFMITLFKFLVTYTISYLLGLVLYTLTVHITFLIIRTYAHGAHATKSIYCHLLNILLFVLLPWVVVEKNLNLLMIIFGLVGVALLIIYSPGITNKQPIPKRFHKRRNTITSILSVIIYVVSFLFIEPYQDLIQYGLLVIGMCQLPLFLPKELN